uniref:Uncharacterized protein n=1 Tax=Magallana gigas TaxID=29159 RepID=K1PKS8_MAGGI
MTARQKGYLVILKEYCQDVYDVQGQPLNRCIGHGELTVGSSDGDVLPKGPATVRLRKGADMFLYDSCKKAHGEGKRKH